MDFRLESEESVFVMRCTPTVWWTWRKWGTYSGDKETLKHSQYWSANVWRKLYTWLNFVIKMRVFESEIVRNNFWHPRNWQRLSSLPLLEEERGQFRNSGEPGRLPRRCSAKMKMLFKFSCSDESKIDKSIIPIGWLRLVKPLSFLSCWYTLLFHALKFPRRAVPNRLFVSTNNPRSLPICKFKQIIAYIEMHSSSLIHSTRQDHLWF